MKKWVIASAVLLAIAASSTGQLDDGFNLLDEGDPRYEASGPDGKRMPIGERRDIEIIRAMVYAIDNANSTFNLTVVLPYDEDMRPGRYVLLLQGVAYRQGGAGASGQETSSMSYSLLGRDAAEAAASHLGASLHLRRHPQHELLVTFTPLEDAYRTDEEVSVRLTARNVGQHSVSFRKGGRNRSLRDNQYIFSARYLGDQVQDIGTSHHFGGLSMRVTIHPGEAFEDAIHLSKWFAFDRAGFYEIHGSYYMAFMDEDDNSYYTIWEDYVSADFYVRIVEE